MALKSQHKLVVSAQPGNENYPFRVDCSCQWQALAHDKAGAESYALSHLSTWKNYSGVTEDSGITDAPVPKPTK